MQFIVTKACKTVCFRRHVRSCTSQAWYGYGVINLQTQVCVGKNKEGQLEYDTILPSTVFGYVNKDLGL